MADDNQSKAICQLCGVKISRGLKIGYFATTNMLKHLSVKHRKEEQEKEKTGEKNATSKFFI